MLLKNNAQALVRAETAGKAELEELFGPQEPVEGKIVGALHNADISGAKNALLHSNPAGLEAGLKILCILTGAQAAALIVNCPVNEQKLQANAGSVKLPLEIIRADLVDVRAHEKDRLVSFDLLAALSAQLIGDTPARYGEGLPGGHGGKGYFGPAEEKLWQVHLLPGRAVPAGTELGGNHCGPGQARCRCFHGGDRRGYGGGKKAPAVLQEETPKIKEKVQVNIMKTIETDVVIVARWPAGLAAAIAAGEKGLKSADTIEWLEEMGVEFAGAFRYFKESEATWHIVKPENGVIDPRAASAMIKAMTERAKELGCEILLGTPAVSLIQEDGKVCGAAGDQGDGNGIEVRSKATIVCPGGSGNNKEMVKEAFGLILGEDFFPFMIPGITGDALRLYPITGKGKYLVGKFYLAAYGTVGGVRINKYCEVLDEDQMPIEGLYSAGSDANTIYGDSYNFTLPGNTMGFAVNPPDTDELCIETRMTGVKGLYRNVHLHALNIKETAIRHSASHGWRGYTGTQGPGTGQDLHR